MMMRESEFSHRAADESLPLRDAFAVLFFVSAGMLFNPKILFEEPLLILTAFILVTFGKGAVTYLIMKIFRQTISDRLILSASMSQIGEFSFILAALALKLKIFSPVVYDMVIASAIISIAINPFLFRLAKRRA
jgi:CPA2 family monovalent cation:H+ antiporter-2